MTKPASVSEKTKKAIDNMADVWAKIEKLSPRATTVRPTGSFTVMEYCENRKCNRATGESQLRVMLENKAVDRAKVAIPSQGGKIVPQWCYFLIDKK